MSTDMEELEEAEQEIKSLNDLACVFNRKFDNLPNKEDMNSALRRLKKKMDEKNGSEYGQNRIP